MNAIKSDVPGGCQIQEKMNVASARLCPYRI